ncbi:hypothetical protein FOA52_006471 [Chlamydomonas sp. UWO 241]|nr:hypothetical protein FOA52_006471 [Chlamydomonas sp. UWO 241]
MSLIHRGGGPHACSPCASSSGARLAFRAAAWAPTPPARHHRGSCVVVRAQADGSFFASIARIAKKVQGSLPIVGLISRLTAPEGGFDDLAYPEYARSIINTSSVEFRDAMNEFEGRRGRLAGSRWVLLMLWMAKTGTGLVPPKDVMNAAKRMNVTQDMEIEMDRFAANREKAVKKYDMVAPPEPRVSDQLAVAVDGIAMLCLGLKEGEPLPEADVATLSAVLKGAFPLASVAAVAASITGRATRTYA